jgi:UPF0755 protein
MTIELASESRPARIQSRVLLLLVFGVSVLVFFSLALYFKVLVSKPVRKVAFERAVVVRRGDSIREIARNLAQAGFLRQIEPFLIVHRLSGKRTSLKAGVYLLKSSMSVQEIYEVLAKGKAGEFRVTVPEGYTIEQAATLLWRRGLINSKKTFLALCSQRQFLQSVEIAATSLEGYLYPDTYFVAPGLSDEEIATMFVKQFRAVTDNLFEGSSSSLTPYEALILASIIEREARLDFEKPTIASVYSNRLAKRLRLESCATVRYVLNKWDAPLTLKDLKVASPYNTYVHKGLPPTPICSPGKVSIQAALKPEETDFLYYCYKGDGTHYFSKTLEEHNQAVKRYLRPAPEDRPAPGAE